MRLKGRLILHILFILIQIKYLDFGQVSATESMLAKMS
jgi:hypothetical protein